MQNIKGAAFILRLLTIFEIKALKVYLASNLVLQSQYICI